MKLSPRLNNRHQLTQQRIAELQKIKEVAELSQLKEKPDINPLSKILVKLTRGEIDQTEAMFMLKKSKQPQVQVIIKKPRKQKEANVNQKKEQDNKMIKIPYTPRALILKQQAEEKDKNAEQEIEQQKPQNTTKSYVA